MEMEKETAYISMRKSLNSFIAVALADYALIKNDVEKEKYSDFVTAKVKVFLHENALDRKGEWDKVEGSHQELSAEETSMCPPGFREENGLCVPINSIDLP